MARTVNNPILRSALISMALSLIGLAIACNDGLVDPISEVDTDGDGWSDRQEAAAGTNIENVDTDGDGFWDPRDANPLNASIPASPTPEASPTPVPASAPEVTPSPIAVSGPTVLAPPTSTPTVTPSPTPDASLVSRGRVLFIANCAPCHSTGPDSIVGPGLADVGERAGSRVSGLSAEDYLRQSIVDPGSFVVAGFPPVMPGFPQFSDLDISSLVEYLKSLSAPPPTATPRPAPTAASIATPAPTSPPQPTATAQRASTATPFPAVTATPFQGPTSTPAATATVVVTVSPASIDIQNRWPGDSNSSDVVGGRNGVAQNGTIFADGRIGSAFWLDGVDDHVRVDPGNQFDFGTSSFSVAAWVRTVVTTGVGNSRDDIVSKGDPTISGFAISAQSNRAYFFLGPSGEFGSTSLINDGGWHHIVGTRDESGLASLYVDGKLENTRQNSESVTTTTDLFIGRHGTSAASYFNGLIDDVIIHDEAWTAQEVKTIYQLGLSGSSLP